VLVVDAANHLGPVALAQLLDQAALSHTKLVLVGGGTVPGRGPSRARSFDQLVDAFAPYKLGPPATAPGYRRPASAHPSLALEGIVVRGALTGADALAQVVAGWQAVAAAGTGRALMVAFGPAEVEALNLAARVARSSPDRGPELVLGDRGYVIGDEVLALRRIGTVRSATPGTVVEVGPSSLAVHWRDGPKGQRTTIDRSHASSLGYGYATTVPYLRGLPAGPSQPGLLVLGDPLCLAARSSLVVAAWVTLAGPGSPALGPNGPAARRRAGIAELATGWPDSAMLQRAGPRPLNSGAHRRWANLVTDCALEREFGLSRPALPGPGPELGHRSARAGRDGVSPAWPTSGASPRLGL
jgi:hypothetical protein